MNRLLREPLLHFLFIGAAIFWVNAWRAKDQPKPTAAPLPVIEINARQIEQMKQVWLRERKRPPLESELRQQIDDYVQEEVLYREALALGLDRDDSVIRQRMAQKMQFLYSEIDPMVGSEVATSAANPDGTKRSPAEARERLLRQKAEKEAENAHLVKDLEKRYRISVDEAALRKATQPQATPPPS